MIDYLLLAIGHLLVWAFGTALVAAVPGRRLPRADDSLQGDGRLAWIVGCGWFVGALLLTLLMRGLSLASIPFGRLSIGGPLFAMTLLAAWVGWRRCEPVALAPGVARLRVVLAGAGLPRWQRILWCVLLAWLALRFGMLLAEIAVRPLYPWDAWMQWATKARTWFGLARIVPFVPMETWLADGTTYFDAAPHYPATVPLWQVWPAVVIGRWDDALTNFAWWITGVALSLAVYGHLRGAGAERIVALVGAWFVASLPILDVHIALAGYADLPMAACITLACLAGLRFVERRDARDLLLLLVFLVALPTIKNPGKAWALLLLPGLLIARWPRWGIRLVGVATGIAVIAVLAIAETRPIILGYRLQATPSLPWQGLVDAYFAFSNWHLLWYGIAAMVVVRFRAALSPAMAPLTATLGIGILFLLFGFAFTNAAAWVEDQSTVNRATLHLAPLLVVWLVRMADLWSRDRSVPAGQPAAPVAR